MTGVGDHTATLEALGVFVEQHRDLVDEARAHHRDHPADLAGLVGLRNRRLGSSDTLTRLLFSLAVVEGWDGPPRNPR